MVLEAISLKSRCRQGRVPCMGSRRASSSGFRLPGKAFPGSGRWLWAASPHASPVYLLCVSLHVASNLGPTQIIQEHLEILHLITSAKTFYLNEATLAGSRDEDMGIAFAGGQVASQVAQW